MQTEVYVYQTYDIVRVVQANVATKEAKYSHITKAMEECGLFVANGSYILAIRKQDPITSPLHTLAFLFEVHFGAPITPGKGWDEILKSITHAYVPTQIYAQDALRYFENGLRELAALKVAN